MNKTESIEPQAPVFILPNGSHLRYAFAGDKGNQYAWFRTQENPRLYLKAPSKKNLPRLGLWNSRSSQHVVCADFDTLPIEYGSFDSLYSFLDYKFSSSGIIVRSASNKVKVFFVVSIASTMNTQVALETLSKLLPEDLFLAVDKTAPALQLSFLTPEIITALRQRLPNSQVIEAVQPIGEGVVGSSMQKQEALPYRSFAGEIENMEIRLAISEQPRIEPFIRILLASTQLLFKNGFGISTVKAGADLCVNPSTVSRWRFDLVERGWLALAQEGRYVPSKVAKGYTATGELRREIERITQLGPQPSEPFTPPTAIADGNWDTTLWRAAGSIQNRDEYMSWFSSLPGFNRLDRPEKANRAFDRRRRFRSDSAQKKKGEGTPS